ncbi:MAG: radical SAM protein [Planctomycetota bacterium]|nr:radical SAM protein [Planctomycetota bacterium]
MTALISHPRPRRRLRLINPRSGLSTISMPAIISKMTFSRRGLFMPLNLAICAAVVPEGWDVEIVDENVTDGPHVPEGSGIDAVGIGAMTTQAPRAYEIADAYLGLGVPVILGGIHPSALPAEAAAHATIVCRGDAESTLPRALADLAAGTPRPLYDWQDGEPAPIATPRKDLLNPKDYLVFNPIQTTRGCPHGCTFCTTPAIFGRRFRQRDIGAIIAEIRQVKEQFNSRVFIFSDDDVAGDQRWALELFDALRPLGVRWASQCDILIARNQKLLRAMKASGCLGLILGLESPRASTLREAGKRYARPEEYLRDIAAIRSHGISIWGSFILGFDGDDWRDCMNAVRFAQRARLNMACYPILTPYPGTELFARYESQGRLLTRDWTKYNGASVVFRPDCMSGQELRHAQMAAFHEFYQMSSSLRRLGLWPVKKFSWIANLAIQRGLTYYYDKRGRRLPRFHDFLDADRETLVSGYGL